MQQLSQAKRRDVQFLEGDWVFLKLQPYRQQTTFKWAYQKLACRYYGSYKSSERLDQLHTNYNFLPRPEYIQSSMNPQEENMRRLQ